MLGCSGKLFVAGIRAFGGGTKYMALIGVPFIRIDKAAVRRRCNLSQAHNDIPAVQHSGGFRQLSGWLPPSKHRSLSGGKMKYFHCIRELVRPRVSLCVSCGREAPTVRALTIHP